MASISDIRAGKAYVEIGGNDSQLVKTLNNAAQRLQKFGSAVRGVGVQVAGAGTAIFAPIGVAGRQFAEHGENIQRGAKQTGLGAEAFSTFGYAANQTGTDADALTNSFAKMSKTIVEAAEGGTEAELSLTELGVSVAQLQNLSQSDRFKLFADRISAIKDPALQSAAAMKIFGRSGDQLLPLLTQGSAGITAMQEHARSLGLEWSGPESEAAAKFYRTLKDLWDVMQRGIDLIGSAAEPVLDKLAKIITTNAQAAKVWVQAHQGLITTVAGVGAALIAAGSAFVIFGTAIDTVGIALGTFASIVGIATTVLTGILTPIGLIVGVSGLAIAAFLNFTSAGAELSSGLRTLLGDATAAFNGIKAAMSVGDFASAARILWGAIEVEWDKGVLYIETAVQNLLKPFVGVVGMMERAWSGLCTFATTAWHGFTSFVAEAWNKLNLGPIFAAVWNGFKTGIMIALNAAVVGFGVMEALVTHWRDTLSLAWAAIELGAVKSVNEIAYLFTEILPTSFGWLVANGPKIVAGVMLKIFDEVGHLIKVVWDYVRDVAPKIGKALWNALKGTANAVVEFDTKAFDAFRRGFGQDVAQTGGPQFQPRVQSQTEKDLQAKVDAKAATVDQEIDDAIAHNKAALAHYTDALKNAVTPNAGDTRAGSTALPDVAAAKKELDEAQAKLNALTAAATAKAIATAADATKGSDAQAWTDQTPQAAQPFAQRARDDAPIGTFTVSQMSATEAFGRAHPDFGAAKNDVPAQQLVELKGIAKDMKAVAQKVGPMRHT